MLGVTELLLEMHRRLSKDMFELTYIQMWQLWFRRNMFVHQNRSLPICYWTQKVISTRDELHLITDKQKMNQVVAESVANRWKKPSAHMVKINVDAAITGEGFVRMGVVGRNSDADVMFTAVKYYPSKWSLQVADAMAVYFGLQTAAEEDVTELVMESDCLQIISHLKDDVFPRNDLGKILLDVRTLARTFPRVVWSHVRRDGNSVAHQLAKNSDIFAEAHWVPSAPSYVSRSLMMDRLGASLS